MLITSCESEEDNHQEQMSGFYNDSFFVMSPMTERKN